MADTLVTLIAFIGSKNYENVEFEVTTFRPNLITDDFLKLLEEAEIRIFLRREVSTTQLDATVLSASSLDHPGLFNPRGAGILDIQTGMIPGLEEGNTYRGRINLYSEAGSDVGLTIMDYDKNRLMDGLRIEAKYAT